MILKLKKQIRKLQSDMNRAFKETESELTKQEEKTKELIKKSVKKLNTLKEPLNQELAVKVESVKKTEKEDRNKTDRGLLGWEIEYDN